MTGAAETIVAAVVTHDRPGPLRSTALRLLEEGVDHLIVVDNGGAGDLAAALPAAMAKRLTVLRPGHNLGGAGGFALALAEAQCRFDPDWFLLTDDDGRPRPGTIAAFRGCDRDEWDAVAAAVYDASGRIAEMNRPALNPFRSLRRFAAALLRGRAGFHLRDADYAGLRPVPVDTASFVGLFLSRRAVARAGYPDGRLFIYGDDVLYSLRMRQRGVRIGFDPRLPFEHDCRTLQGPARIYRPLWKLYYHHRNILLVLRAAGGPLLFPLLLAAYLPRWFLRLRHYRPDEWRTCLSLLMLALRDGLSGEFGRAHEAVLVRAASAPPHRAPGSAATAGAAE